MNYIIYFFFQLNEIREVVDGELGFAASQERDLKQDEQVTVINVSLSTPFPLFFFSSRCLSSFVVLKNVASLYVLFKFVCLVLLFSYRRFFSSTRKRLWGV